MFRILVFVCVLSLSILGSAEDISLPDPLFVRTCGGTRFRYPVIIVHKAERILRLYTDFQTMVEYPISMGKDPICDKVVQGDCATPEGEFYICKKNRNSPFHRFLGISYPNVEDAERGLRDHLISREEYETILRASRGGETPLWNTMLGGNIGIHGGGVDRDWTLGCIAMRDEDVEAIYDVVQRGTSVIVLP